MCQESLGNHIRPRRRRNRALKIVPSRFHHRRGVNHVIFASDAAASTSSSSRRRLVILPPPRVISQRFFWNKGKNVTYISVYCSGTVVVHSDERLISITTDLVTGILKTYPRLLKYVPRQGRWAGIISVEFHFFCLQRH